MNKILLWTIVTFCCFISWVIKATEQNISFDVEGQKVIGTLVMPDESAEPLIVLILHGFGGQRHELEVKGTGEGLYTRVANKLSEQGIGSLRIDFRGSGDSEGNWADTTISSQVKDANAAILWLKHNIKTKISDISLLGWSQGGLVSSHVARYNTDLKSVVLWAPVTNPYFTYSKIWSPEFLDKAMIGKEGELMKYNDWMGNTKELKTDFVKGALVKHPLAAISKYKGPLLVIAGKRDEIVKRTEAWIEYHDGIGKHVELDASHSWDILETNSVVDKKLIPITVAWFKKYE